MAVTRLSDWGWQVNLSGDLLSSEWWHHDKAECHHFAAAGKEIGREMAESWTGLHDAKAVPCPTTLPCFHQGGVGPLLYSQSRLLIGVHVFQIWVRPCVEKNSFIRCQSFVLTTRESSFNILGRSFWTVNAVSVLRCLLKVTISMSWQLNIICKVWQKNNLCFTAWTKVLDRFLWLFMRFVLLFFDLFIAIVQGLYCSATVDELLLYPDAKPKS